jgi:hypothetical protein
LPGGLAEHRKRLEAEGFHVTTRGKSSLVVPDYEKKLASLKP